MPPWAMSPFLMPGLPALGVMLAMVLGTFTVAWRKGLMNSAFMFDRLSEKTVCPVHCPKKYNPMEMMQQAPRIVSRPYRFVQSLL